MDEIEHDRLLAEQAEDDGYCQPVHCTCCGWKGQADELLKVRTWFHDSKDPESIEVTYEPCCPECLSLAGIEACKGA